MDQQSGTRDVDDLRKIPVQWAKHTMTIDRRQKNDCELSPLVKSDVDIGEQRADRVFDTFDGHQRPFAHPADVLDRPVTRTEQISRATWDGASLRLHPSSEQGVEGSVVPEGQFRFLLV